MTGKKYDVAIIGAGTAGLHAYKAARAGGANVVIVERGPGGSTCTRTGCIPSKLLIAAGRAAHHARNADTFGISVGSVGIDGRAVMERLRRQRDDKDGNIRDEYFDFPAESRLHGQARFTGRNLLSVDGATIEADAIIIAAGAHPTVPPMLDPVRALVHTHESIFEITDLPRAMAVVGAGPIGLELAQAFARLGVSVTLLDKANVVGATSDPEAEKALRAALSSEFAIHLGVDVTTDMVGACARVSWSGAEEGSVEVDCVLAATGRKPNLAALDLAATGIALDDDGVPIFDPTTRRCGDSSIYIAGDVGGWRPVLHEAARGGRIAGTMASGGASCRQIPNLAITFTDPGLAEIGCRFDDLPEGATIGRAMLADNVRAQIDAADKGIVRLYGDAGGKLIGGSIVATAAEHLGHEVAIAIDAGMSIANFTDQAWYHPVLEEVLQSAARDLRH